MKIATLGLVAAVCAGVAGTALAGPNAGGYMLLHTDDSVIYTEDDEATYCGLLSTECPFDPGCVGPFDDCVDFAYFGVNPTSGRDGTASEVSMIWAIAAFPDTSCPRVAALQFGLSWAHDLSADPSFVAWGSCGDFEITTEGWPGSLNSGSAVTWGNTITRHAFPFYWFAAYQYYADPTTISIARFPTGDVGASFADDSIPSILDPVESSHWGSLGLNGAVGVNPYEKVNPTFESSWGEVKAIFGR